MLSTRLSWINRISPANSAQASSVKNFKPKNFTERACLGFRANSPKRDTRASGPPESSSGRADIARKTSPTSGPTGSEWVWMVINSPDYFRVWIITNSPQAIWPWRTRLWDWPLKQKSAKSGPRTLQFFEKRYLKCEFFKNFSKFGKFI